MTKPTLGRIVQYVLSATDAEQINRRRTSGDHIKIRMNENYSGIKWPAGAQAHIGNPARPGQCFPLLITNTWADEFGSGFDGVNGQVFLDGNDVLWVTSVKETSIDEKTEGCWFWPFRQTEPV